MQCRVSRADLPLCPGAYTCRSGDDALFAKGHGNAYAFTVFCVSSAGSGLQDLEAAIEQIVMQISWTVSNIEVCVQVAADESIVFRVARVAAVDTSGDHVLADDVASGEQPHMAVHRRQASVQGLRVYLVHDEVGLHSV